MARRLGNLGGCSLDIDAVGLKSTFGSGTNDDLSIPGRAGLGVDFIKVDDVEKLVFLLR